METASCLDVRRGLYGVGTAPIPTHVHNAEVAALSKTRAPEVTQRVTGIQALTVVRMSAEAVLSLGAAWASRSPALIGFGGDSAIELLSAVVVLRRFQVPSARAHVEERAAKIAGGLLFALAAFVMFASILSLLGRIEPRPSVVGIAVLIVAAVTMPLLAQHKRRLSVVTGSAALRADAAESAVCGYLAWISLAGLVVNAIWGIKCADPVAAVGLLPLIVREGWEALEGRACGDC